MTEPIQIDRVRQIEADMRALMLNTNRCDRDLAESSIKDVYKSLGRDVPETFVWFPSPIAAIPAAMLCALTESAKSQLDSVESRALAQVKKTDPNFNDALDAVKYLSEETQPGVVDPIEEPLFPLTKKWRGWLGNLDLNEHSICYTRRILDITPFLQNESRGIYGQQIPRLFSSASNVQRNISRAAMNNMKQRMTKDPSVRFFEETIEHLLSATGNSTFSGEITRVIETIKRLSAREQQFVLECLFGFVFDGGFDHELLKFRFGQHEADSVTRLIVGKMVGLPLGSDPTLFAKVSGASGWWCPFPNICLMIDRPTEIHFDNKDLLNNTEGPACRYEDGWGFFALGGIQVSMATALGQFGTMEIGDEINIERRRVMIDRYGIEKYLKDSGARPVSEDECGRLFRISPVRGQQATGENLEGALAAAQLLFEQMNEPIQIVEVKNSTPEPDGSYKLYYLRVPPTIRTAQEAVAWTFGLEQNEYKPATET